jgi:hypothetical protein
LKTFPSLITHPLTFWMFLRTVRIRQFTCVKVPGLELDLDPLNSRTQSSVNYSPSAVKYSKFSFKLASIWR